jgi:protein-disulfide isomerase
MTGPARTAAALLATGLLAACAANPAPPFTPQRRAPLGQAATPEEVLPGVDLSGLEPAQRQAVAEWSQAAFSYCGAPRTVSTSLRQGSGCAHAPRMAQLAVRLAGMGLEKEKLSRAVTDYYASFDERKRARLDVDHFGPPLGDPRAPVAVVEFSDFTCPFCQRFRPTLEKFVADRPGRVRLHFKPYAIESHANSLEAASAAEWARDRGAFWKMHDTLFDNPFVADPESLVGFARELGLDAGDLAAALKSERLAPRVRASMAEAKAAGIAGTPTLFVNGRMLRAGEFTEPALEFTLQDEEEWQRNGGWKRD